MTLNFRRLALAALALGLALTADAAPQKTQYSTVDLIAEQASLPADGGTITVGLYLKPDPTWHAYWINPGDAGKEPTLSWKLPDGFDVGEFVFPAPHLLPFGELNTYGFEEPILLLADVVVPAGLPADEPVTIGGKASWVVCDDKVCVPERASVSLSLPVGDGADDAAVAEQFSAARAKVPASVDWPAQFSVSGDKVTIEIAAAESPSLDGAYLFIESRKLVKYGSQIAGATRAGVSFAMDAGRRFEEVETTGAVLSFVDAAGESRNVALQLMRSDAPLAAASNGSTGGAGGLSFFKAVVFAFLGGIILNLMPCVFPILSMKALSLVQMGAQDQRAARESGVIYTIGILVAFAAIAIVMLVLREAGDAVGWGFQMQNPLIVVGLGLLMVAVGLNLFGVFEIGTRIMGVGQGLTEGGERKAAFFTGLLAVVVATPCMAPFMAAALGYALTQPVVTSLSVFLSLGFGLAFPYLVLSFVPAIGRVLPKPGAWMETLKHVLAFPMFLTALWLFWIVGQQLGATSMFVALLAAVAAAFALWAYGKGMLSQTKVRWYATALVGVVATVYAFTQVEEYRVVHRAADDHSAGMLGGLELEHFDPQRVQQYIADGQPTFVYFTADWCISCKANEKVALSTDEVADAFNARGIKVVEGDWTTEDPVITEWLERYGRAGVPLYLYFPTGSSLDTVTILPQILTPGIVVDAIVEADAGAPTMVAKGDVAEVEEEQPPYVIPSADPDWGPVQKYIDLDTDWHAIDNEIRAADISKEEKDRRKEEERGPHPDIEDAMAAAAAIVRLEGGHAKMRDAAAFLVEHTRGTPGQNEAMLLGINKLAQDFPDYEDWPTVLFSADFYVQPGSVPEIDEMFENFAAIIPDQPVAAATAKYYAASRRMRLANAVETLPADRPMHRERGIELATGLSLGVENEKLVKQRRLDRDGNPIEYPSMAEAEEDLLYNLNFLTVGNTIPDVSALNLAGVEESVSTYRGQAVLLDFWATWCGPCIASIPKMEKLDAELPEGEFEILSISVDAELDTVIEFQENKPMPWANWHVGPKADLLTTWQVRGYPTYILVDHDGTIIARQHDLNEDFDKLIRATACGPTGGESC